MAYDPSGLQNVIPGMSNTDNRLWILNTTDPIATVNTSNYISDGVKRGMSQNIDARNEGNQRLGPGSWLRARGGWGTAGDTIHVTGNAEIVPEEGDV